MFDRLNGIAALLVSGFIGTSAATAALRVDLRFDGTGDLKSREVAPNTQYVINIFAQVRGTDANGANDGINFILGAIQSEQVNGGSVVGGTGVGVTSVTFHQAFADSNASNTRTQSNTSFDSIADWGNPGANNTSIKPSASGTTGVYLNSSSNAATVTGSLLNHGSSGAGSEYLLGFFRFNTGATIGEGTTLINWLKPTYTTAAQKVHAIYLDGSTSSVNGTGNYRDTYFQSSANGVSLLAPNPIPEPSTLALATVVAVGLLSRRRRRMA